MPGTKKPVQQDGERNEPYNASICRYFEFLFVVQEKYRILIFRASNRQYGGFMDTQLFLPPVKSYLTVEEAAAYLQVSPATIYRFIAKKQLPVFRFGRIMRISIVALDAFIEQNTIKEPSITP